MIEPPYVGQTFCWARWEEEHSLELWTRPHLLARPLYRPHIMTGQIHFVPVGLGFAWWSLLMTICFFFFSQRREIQTQALLKWPGVSLRNQHWRKLPFKLWSRRPDGSVKFTIAGPFTIPSQELVLPRAFAFHLQGHKHALGRLSESLPRSQHTQVTGLTEYVVNGRKHKAKCRAGPIWKSFQFWSGLPGWSFFKRKLKLNIKI